MQTPKTLCAHLSLKWAYHGHGPGIARIPGRAVFREERIERFDLVTDECTDPFELRSEEHTSELQSLMRTSYAVFCLKKKKNKITDPTISHLSILTPSEI